MALLDDIATQLESQLVATGTTAWAIKKSYLPDEPDRIVCIFEAPGDAPGADPSGSAQYDFPGFQIRLRGEAFKYDDARDKMQDVFDALHDKAVTNYIYIFATDQPMLLNYDEQSRPILVLNFKTMRTRGA